MELHGFLNVDKPLGWTSHDVVGRLRRIVGTRRIGHAGTLDPAATGVLIIGVGRGTRFLEYIQRGSKAYVAHVVLGVESDAADIDGRLMTAGDPGASFHETDRSQIERILAHFIGTIDQIPPKYSAIKQRGEPLHRRMRRGEEVEVPVRHVDIASIEIVHYQYPDLILNVSCGSGVYIRSLARDIGERLGTSAYLHHLVRTRVGQFVLDQSRTLDQIDRLSFPSSWTSVATSIDGGLVEFPAIYLDREGTGAWYHGRSIRTRFVRTLGFETFRAFAWNGTFAGIGTSPENGASDIELRPRVVLASN